MRGPAIETATRKFQPPPPKRRSAGSQRLCPAKTGSARSPAWVRPMSSRTSCISVRVLRARRAVAQDAGQPGKWGGGGGGGGGGKKKGMSQTTIERLRDYLAQLPPQSQALLMRQFERAVERGEEIRHRQSGARAAAQDRSQGGGRGRGASAHRRSGAAIVSPARAVSRRGRFSGPARTNPPRLAAADMAMARARRRARAGARIRGGMLAQGAPAGRCPSSGPPAASSSLPRRR